jgi:E3 ubiquitin-protein ligase DOA10
MKDWGTVYVAVSKRAYERYFSKNLKPRDSEKADYERRKEFYVRLFTEGELVWERESRGIVYLQPGLRLYRLDHAR